MPTPLVYQGVLYLLNNNGRLTAYDAATGEEIYRERVGRGESFSSSPVASDGRLFFSSEDGSTFVIRAGRDYELLGTNELGDIVMTTPAISDGTMLIRGAMYLWALGVEKGHP
jgi:outer membrane protein assembly factor BamB